MLKDWSQSHDFIIVHFLLSLSNLQFVEAIEHSEGEGDVFDVSQVVSFES